MDWSKFIEVSPGVRGGEACLVGTRITPTDILEYLARGVTEDEILKNFPSVSHIRAVLAYAAERERRYATHSVA